MRILLLTILLCIAATFVEATNRDSVEVSIDPDYDALPREEMADDLCRQVPHCWAARHKLGPLPGLRFVTDRTFVWTYRWIAPLEGGTFHTAKWSPDNPSVILYEGDQLEKQTKYGAWVRMQYRCKYYTETGKISEPEYRERGSNSWLTSSTIRSLWEYILTGGK